jgi:hypothetical protein
MPELSQQVIGSQGSPDGEVAGHLIGTGQLFWDDEFEPETHGTRHVCDRPHPIGVVEREINRDAAAPAMADHRSALNAESIEDGDRIVHLRNTSAGPDERPKSVGRNGLSGTARKPCQQQARKGASRRCLRG